MNIQRGGIVRVVMIFGAVACLVPADGTAQSSSPVPRLADGRPDLGGVWDFGSVTPLQRPAALAGKEFLTDEDVSALEAQAAAGRIDQVPRAGDPGSYNQFWMARGSTVAGTRLCRA